MVTDRSVVQVASHQVSSDLAEEAVVMDLEDGVYYGLNEVGARIWQLIQEPRSVDEIQAALSEEYDVEPERCRQDIISLLQELDEHNLLKVKQK